MFGNEFYFSLIRKYVVLVGKIFDDISIERVDASSKELQLVRVPVIYSAKEKMLSRVVQDPSANRPSAMVASPTIAFEMTGMHYRAEDKLTTTTRISVHNANDPNSLLTQYREVPYDIDFSVYIYAKETEDANRVIEQILPFYTPDWCTTVQLIEETNENRDISVVLNSVSHEDNYEGEVGQRRIIIWTLNLTLKGYFYAPIRSQGVIKFVSTRFFIPVGNNTIAQSIGTSNAIAIETLQPGYTANGQPTTNAAASIPYLQVDIEDDYGYASTLLEPGDNFVIKND